MLCDFYFFCIFSLFSIFHIYWNHLCLLKKEIVEREYFLEREAAQKEFEEKKVELKENLISDLEEKKRIIEAERNNMELTGGIL